MIGLVLLKAFGSLFQNDMGFLRKWKEGRKWRKETTIRSSGITNNVAISQPHNVLALLIMVSVLRILLLIMLDTV